MCRRTIYPQSNSLLFAYERGRADALASDFCGCLRCLWDWLGLREPRALCYRQGYFDVASCIDPLNVIWRMARENCPYCVEGIIAAEAAE